MVVGVSGRRIRKKTEEMLTLLLAHRNQGQWQRIVITTWAISAGQILSLRIVTAPTHAVTILSTLQMRNLSTKKLSHSPKGTKWRLKLSFAWLHANSQGLSPLCKTSQPFYQQPPLIPFSLCHPCFGRFYLLNTLHLWTNNSFHLADDYFSVPASVSTLIQTLTPITEGST